MIVSKSWNTIDGYRSVWFRVARLDSSEEFNFSNRFWLNALSLGSLLQIEAMESSPILRVLSLFFSKIVWRRFLFFAAGCSGSPAVIGYREIAGGKTSRADRTAVGVAFANEATILGIYPDDIPFSGGA